MANASQKSRILGIDYGLARIGLAVSDETKTIAMPFKIITAEKRAEITAEKVVKELDSYQITAKTTIEEIVIGLPLLLSGKKGMLADEVHHFITLLSQFTKIPIVTWDERLTTVQAERSMREGNMTRKKRSKIVDTVAAVILLQNYLDYKKIKEQKQLVD
jgi:putative holliday junction resolvase